MDRPLTTETDLPTRPGMLDPIASAMATRQKQPAIVPAKTPAGESGAGKSPGHGILRPSVHASDGALDTGLENPHLRLLHRRFPANRPPRQHDAHPLLPVSSETITDGGRA